MIETRERETEKDRKGKDVVNSRRRLTKRQPSHLSTHTPILVRRQESVSPNKPRPDRDVGQNPGGQTLRADHDRAIPEQGHKSPSQRSADDRDMLDPYIGRRFTERMSRVQREEVEEIK